MRCSVLGGLELLQAVRTSLPSELQPFVCASHLGCYSAALAYRRQSGGTVALHRG